MENVLDELPLIGLRTAVHELRALLDEVARDLEQLLRLVGHDV